MVEEAQRGRVSAKVRIATLGEMFMSELTMVQHHGGQLIVAEYKKIPNITCKFSWNSESFLEKQTGIFILTRGCTKL
jgi:hypothetical protein